MSRMTSIAAYYAVQESGHIGQRQRELYNILYEHGPKTANECFTILADAAKVAGKEFKFDSNTHARFTELRQMGVIQELGNRVCSSTKRKAILWDVTDRSPTILKGVPGKMAQLEMRLGRIEIRRGKVLDEIAKLKPEYEKVVAGTGN